MYPVMMPIKFQKSRVYNSVLKWVSKLLGQIDPPPRGIPRGLRRRG
jgi:hypothetical protein